MGERDGHVRVLPIHVANKIAAGEVVERPASVVKELVENSIDAGAGSIKITVTQGGRKLISVLDDGCGMIRDDAVLAFERQATSKILDVGDIENIDTLGFRGEAIPSIASVSRFTMTTRRHDSDEGTSIQVNAGVIAEVRSAGCPPGTLIEVRDLFCNVPVRRKFLRSYATEESHVRSVFTIHALAHPSIGFTLVSDSRELYRLPQAGTLTERVRDLFGSEFLESMLPVGAEGAKATGDSVKVTGYIEKPNQNTPTRRDQYIFINGRPATSPSITYAIREAYPRHQGDVRPAAILFIELPPNQVDVNVHPTKREVRFRNNVAVKSAISEAIETALSKVSNLQSSTFNLQPSTSPTPTPTPSTSHLQPSTSPTPTPTPTPSTSHLQPSTSPTPTPTPTPTQVEFAVEPDSTASKPWTWFKFLAITDSGFLLIETDSGIVTINPHAARERIAYEQLLNRNQSDRASQVLLIPETVRLTPTEFARAMASMDAIVKMGFKLEPFGTDTFKIDEVPQLIGEIQPGNVIATIARDLAEGPGRKSGEKWREELIAKSIARSFAGKSLSLNESGAVKLVEELSQCRMPYVCPRGKPIMIFTSTSELNRKFSRN